MIYAYTIIHLSFQASPWTISLIPRPKQPQRGLLPVSRGYWKRSALRLFRSGNETNGPLGYSYMWESGPRGMSGSVIIAANTVSQLHNYIILRSHVSVCILERLEVSSLQSSSVFDYSYLSWSLVVAVWSAWLCKRNDTQWVHLHSLYTPTCYIISYADYFVWG